MKTATRYVKFILDAKGYVSKSIRLLLQAATYADQPIRQKYHFHNSYELIFIRKGAIRLTVEQKQYIMSAGSLAIISCLENHSTEILSKEYERYYILIYSNRLDAVVSDAALSSIFRNRPFAFNHVVDMTASFDAIDRCFRAIIDEYNQPKDYSRLLLTSYLNEILVHVFRTVPSDFASVSGNALQEIYRIQIYIEHNFSSEIRISDLANENYISPQYLSRCFKSQTGFSPKQYLTNIRLKNAKDRLLHTTLSVHEISFQCGFSDVNNFIRVFKKHTGMTPYKFRLLK